MSNRLLIGAGKGKPPAPPPNIGSLTQVVTANGNGSVIENNTFVVFDWYPAGTFARTAWGLFYHPGLTQGVTITSANLTIKMTGGNETTPNLQIEGDDTDTSVVPASYAAQTTKLTNATAANVSITTGWTVGDTKVADVTTIVQEIVNRVGYVDGTGIGLLFHGENNHYDTSIFDAVGFSSPPHLDLVY